MAVWSVQHAKVRFSELLVACQREAPRRSRAAAQKSPCWCRSSDAAVIRGTGAGGPVQSPAGLWADQWPGGLEPVGGVLGVSVSEGAIHLYF